MSLITNKVSKVITLKKAPESGSVKIAGNVKIAGSVKIAGIVKIAGSTGSAGSVVTPKSLVTLLKPHLRNLDPEQKRLTLDKINAQLKTRQDGSRNPNSGKITVIARPATNIRIRGLSSISRGFIGH